MQITNNEGVKVRVTIKPNGEFVFKNCEANCSYTPDEFIRNLSSKLSEFITLNLNQ